ncbi:hypothetical protein JCM24511_08362 [Saitozyma sp. JCM 24511]|nr:hypothetical protein JCM24511_08362 [Saitozyma sp. JCM 24511]
MLLGGSGRSLAVLRIVLCRVSPSNPITPAANARCPRSVSTISALQRHHNANAPSRTRARTPSSSTSPSASHSTSSTTRRDPLSVSVPLDANSLPVEPLPLAIPRIPAATITPEALQRLHRLSALNPPPSGSQEEKEVLAELGTLVGLMDLVQAVEMEVGLDVGGLLADGVGEVVIDGSHEMGRARTGMEAGAEAESSTSTSASTTIEADIVGLPGERRETPHVAGAPEHSHKSGRELLEYATRRVGDYYGFRKAPREQ